jgi:acetyl-CoA carboxylase biotin carboxyl carrier protein
MDSEQIIRLIEAVAKSSLTEFEYQEGEVRIGLKKASPVYAQVPTTVGMTVAPDAGEFPIVSQSPEESQEGYEDGNIVKSPLVGTFYSAASEEAEPFVRVGDMVKKGQVIGIIETMKLMNEVESDRDGVVVAVLIENEQVVEFGQPLFAIR